MWTLAHFGNEEPHTARGYRPGYLGLGGWFIGLDTSAVRTRIYYTFLMPWQLKAAVTEIFKSR